MSLLQHPLQRVTGQAELSFAVLIQSRMRDDPLLGRLAGVHELTTSQVVQLLQG